MPTPEEIKKLSDAYAEYMCPVGDYCGGVYDDQRNSDLPIYKDDAKSVLEWLSKDYCIVPKSKVKEWYDSAKKTADYFPNAPRVSPLNRAKATIEILGRLFSKSLFEEEER